MTTSTDESGQPFISPHAEGTEIRVYVQPRASRTAILGTYGDRLKIAVSCPPAEGRANTEMRRFLARLLRVPKSSVVLAAGAGSRAKRVVIVGRSPEETTSILGVC